MNTTENPAAVAEVQTTTAAEPGTPIEKKMIFIVRVNNSENKSQRGFQYPEVGPVECPADCLGCRNDPCGCVWKPTEECGNGLHGWEHCIGDTTASSFINTEGAKWQLIEVEDHADNLVRMDGKVKFRRGNVIITGKSHEVTAKLVELGGLRPGMLATAYTAGDAGSATAGDAGSATAGNRGSATAGNRGSATAGYAGSATAGNRGSATAGEDGVIRVMWWDGDSSKYRVKNGIIGESVDAAGNVLKPNRYYELNEEHKFISLSLDKRIEVVRGDITAQEEPFDLIVNAANESLLGGGGVDGAIHKAAGPALLDACKSLNGCLPGDAKITKGFKLRARFIAHAVGPRWVDGKAGEAEVLAAVYKRVIELATEKGLTSIAAPSISTGAFGYPLGEASGIAMRTVAALLENARIRRFRFVCFDAKTERAYDAAKRTVLGL